VSDQGATKTGVEGDDRPGAEPRRSLPVWNAATARFSCVWPRCDGACCKASRPPVSPGEERIIRAQIERVLPMVRPVARKVIARGAWVTKRRKSGRPTLAIAGVHCVFYADGCVLHKLGAAEGDKNKYKPETCITFPLDRDDRDRWYVRQRGVAGEEWDLECLDPTASDRAPADSLSEEIAFAERVEAGLERWRR
jgi:hypothetical protein